MMIKITAVEKYKISLPPLFYESTNEATSLRSLSLITLVLITAAASTCFCGSFFAAQYRPFGQMHCAAEIGARFFRSEFNFSTILHVH